MPVRSKGSLTGSESGAPVNADYILQTPNAFLPSAQDISSLATGILKGTTGTGVLSVAVLGTDYGNVVGPGSSTDNALCRFDGVTGKIIQDSLAILNDSGHLSGITRVNITGPLASTPLLHLSSSSTTGTGPMFSGDFGTYASTSVLAFNFTGVLALGIEAKLANTTSSASASAGVRLRLSLPTGTGDTFISHEIGAAQVIAGVDGSDLKYKIGAGSIFGINDTVTVDTVNNRLGINNASPAHSLDVTGTSIFSSNVGFFSTTPAAKQTSGANLTNNVTAGGVNDTIANFTDLVIYANDASAIRNDIHQLARKLKQINDGLRTYGLFT